MGKVSHQIKLEMDLLQIETGMSSAQCARWLHRKYQIKISRQSVWRILNVLEYNRHPTL
jgi:hypothetical protein